MRLEESLAMKKAVALKAGRIFPVIPRSNNQTSPRAGVMLFGVEA